MASAGWEPTRVKAAWNLAGLQLFLGIESLQFGGTPGGKNAENREFAGMFRHGTGIQDGQVANGAASGIHERRPEITDDLERVVVPVIRMAASS